MIHEYLSQDGTDAKKYETIYSMMIEEIKKALVSINGLATGVDKQINAVKSSFGTAYKLAFNATSKLKGTAATLIGGLIAGYKMFSKKNK